LLGSVFACSEASKSEPLPGDAAPSCANAVRDGEETGVDCGGACPTACPDGGAGDGGQHPIADAGDAGDAAVAPINKPDAGPKCGFAGGPKCAEGEACEADSECEGACSYAHKCIAAPSCKPHLGGDTCGKGEVGEPDSQHESCCRTLKVPGFVDGAHAGKTVYLDKYEITAGRMRAFVEQMARERNGKPDIRGWIASHRPLIWDAAWEAFLPSDAEGGQVTIGRRLLGDPRPEDWGSNDPPGPGVILPPATDQVRHMGTNYQFGSEIYVDLHGNNCGTYPGASGFPTYYYPPDVLARDGQLARADGLGANGQKITAKDLLDVKSMNCVTNAMLAAFCQWDGGQLATDEVLDFVTGTPATLGNVSGCGIQVDDHGELLGNVFDHTVQSGGRCAPVGLVNVTFDAGDTLPVPGSPLNRHNYMYPATGFPTHDKSWQISAPGRASLANGQQADVVRLSPADEPWMDLHGNLSEAALDVSGAAFTGGFSLKYRGIGYGSSRSDLNVTLMNGETIPRIRRPEAKAAYAGGRCMRFK
jgi:hypothetical protein